MEEDQVKRWIEDDQVDPFIQKAIAAARQEEPEAKHLERVTAAVITGLGVGQSGGAAGTEGMASGSSLSSGNVSVVQFSVIKLTSIAVLVGGISAVVGTQLLKHKTSDTSSVPVVQEVDSVPKIEERTTPNEPNDAVPNIEEQTTPIQLNEAMTESVEQDIGINGVPVQSSKKIMRNQPELEVNPEEEIRLLQRAKRLLSDSPIEALRLASEHERRFGSGIFAQERESIIIEAYNKTGKTNEASRRLKWFKERWPHSVYLRRLEVQQEAVGNKN